MDVGLRGKEMADSARLEQTFWQQVRQSLRVWVASLRDERAETPEPEMPESEEIVFHTLEPVAAPKATLDSFGELTEDWIARQCNSLCFEQAHWYPRNRQVGLLEANPLQISALTQGRSAYRQAISLQGGQLAATCTCRTGQVSAEMQNGTAYCRHVIAALLAYLELQGSEHEATQLAALDCLCPITRRQITSARTIYQCSRCKTPYSPEGWQFLQQEDRGRCCTCHERNTIAPLPR